MWGLNKVFPSTSKQKMLLADFLHVPSFLDISTENWNWFVCSCRGSGGKLKQSGLDLNDESVFTPSDDISNPINAKWDGSMFGIDQKGLVGCLRLDQLVRLHCGKLALVGWRCGKLSSSSDEKDADCKIADCHRRPRAGLLEQLQPVYAASDPNTELLPNRQKEICLPKDKKIYTFLKTKINMPP